jgi:hypothetical protein
MYPNVKRRYGKKIMFVVSLDSNEPQMRLGSVNKRGFLTIDGTTQKPSRSSILFEFHGIDLPSLEADFQTLKDLSLEDVPNSPSFEKQFANMCLMMLNYYVAHTHQIHHIRVVRKKHLLRVDAHRIFTKIALSFIQALDTSHLRPKLCFCFETYSPTLKIDADFRYFYENPMLRERGELECIGHLNGILPVVCDNRALLKRLQSFHLEYFRLHMNFTAHTHTPRMYFSSHIDSKHDAEEQMHTFVDSFVYILLMQQRGAFLDLHWKTKLSLMIVEKLTECKRIDFNFEQVHVSENYSPLPDSTEQIAKLLTKCHGAIQTSVDDHSFATCMPVLH